MSRGEDLPTPAPTDQHAPSGSPVPVTDGNTGNTEDSVSTEPDIGPDTATAPTTTIELSRPRTEETDNGDESIPSVGELARQTPRLVWFLVALTAFVAAFCTVFYPNYRGPDEVAHTGMIVAMAERSANWQPGSMPVQEGVFRSQLIPAGRLNGSLHLSKRSIAPSSQRRSYSEMGGKAPTHVINWLAQHPPLFYASAGSVLSIIPHWQNIPFDRVVLILRLLSVLLLIPVPWFCYAAARTLGASQGVSVAAAATPLMSPMLIHVSAVVNNDGLITTLGAFVVWIAARVVRGDFRVRTAFQLGLLSSGIMLTKGFGLVVVFMVGVIYLYALFRYRGHGWWHRLWRCGLAFLGPALIGLSWWFSNLLQYHRLQPNGLLLPNAQNKPIPTPHTTFAESGSRYTWTWLDDFSQRYWFDDPTGSQSSGLLHLIALIATILVIGAILYCLISGRLSRGFVATIVVCIVITILQLITAAWPDFAAIGRVGSAQGRYLFGFAAAIGLVLAFTLGAVCRGSERWTVRIAIGVALVMSLVNGYYTLQIYWLPRPGTGNRIWAAVQNILDVSPAPPWTVIVLIIGIVVLAVITVIEALRFGTGGTPWLRLPGRPVRSPARSSSQMAATG